MGDWVIHTFRHENRNENNGDGGDGDRRSLRNLHKGEVKMLEQPFTDTKELILKIQVFSFLH